MTAKPRIFSTHTLHPDIASQLSEIGELKISSAPTQKAIETECAGANYIVVRAHIAPHIVENGTGLKALVRHGAGLDMIPVEICSNAGVLVANVPGVNAQTVAEHVIWTTLALMRRYPEVNSDLRSAGWETGRAHSDAGIELTGKTIGIVGMGNIGSQIATMATSAFKADILTFTRTINNLPDYVEPVSLRVLLKKSDVVVLCCPLNEETKGMIADEEFRQMKNNAILINVGRGPLLEEEALLNTLNSGKLAGVALDVFHQQPLAPDHPLFGFRNVIITPHMAGITTESMLRMGQGVVDEIKRIETGQLPKNFVNPEALSLFRAKNQSTFGNGRSD